MTPPPFPRLETARLRLRPFAPGDLEALRGYRADPEVTLLSCPGALPLHPAFRARRTD
ncbi:RimJ/RimL family protein N-acetyltransferase [Deinobacterium chartae]|uniref:RimJ/RimL family protein N-acetyltransferase n=1 Tax=Deinobacterium chartae TaxID=521158 RepID=A0A841I3M0_9DEIO|nr:hypothetical protein [Deinobacterium chartae]MBB6099010.1 RimJ/RimL family protein N-acetyltransferase [Deinobacterium chartae]